MIMIAISRFCGPVAESAISGSDASRRPRPKGRIIVHFLGRSFSDNYAITIHALPLQ